MKPRVGRSARRWSRAKRRWNAEFTEKPHVHSTVGDAAPGPEQEPAQDTLFNLAADINEQHDLAAEQPAKVAELRKLYADWSDEVDADCRS